MSQQFFPAELCGKFFLKEPKSKKPTPLLFVIRLKDRLCKFTTHTKIYSTQWNQRLQKAYISSILSNIDNQNNLIVNEKIEETKKRFDAFKLYLCSINEPDVNTIYTLLKNEFRSMSRQKKIKKDQFDDIIKEIQNTVYNDTTLKRGTSDNYIKKDYPHFVFR